jgi:hypothetical protein
MATTRCPASFVGASPSRTSKSHQVTLDELRMRYITGIALLVLGARSWG